MEMKWLKSKILELSHERDKTRLNLTYLSIRYAIAEMDEMQLAKLVINIQILFIEACDIRYDKYHHYRETSVIMNGIFKHFKFDIIDLQFAWEQNNIDLMRKLIADNINVITMLYDAGYLQLDEE